MSPIKFGFEARWRALSEIQLKLQLPGQLYQRLKETAQLAKCDMKGVINLCAGDGSASTAR